MSAQSKESTTIRQRIMRKVHVNEFQTQRIGLTGIVTLIFQMKATMSGRHKMNPTWSKKMESRMRKAKSSGL